MCLAVPVRVEEIVEAGQILCRVGASETFVVASDVLLEEEPHVGDYVIVHAGFALRKIEPKEAEETLRLLREMTVLADAEHAKQNAQG